MRSIAVYDDRFSGPRLVGKHERIPAEWSADEVIKRFGIAKHLKVYETVDGHTRTIQPYQEWSADRFV